MSKYRWLLLCLVIVVNHAWALERFERLGWFESNAKVNELVQYPSLVEQVYRENDDHMIWLDIQQSSQLEFQLEIIKRAGFSPLFTRQLSYLQYFRDSNRWFEYDVLATDTLLLYMSYAEQAPKLGEQWFFDHKLTKRLAPPSHDAIMALYTAMELQQLDELVEAYTPISDNYQGLVENYLQLKHFSEADLPVYRQRGLAKPGDNLTGRDKLITRLQVVGIDTSQIRTDVSWYDDTLEQAVKQFQRMHGLEVDGIIGPSTLHWLNLTPNKRMATLALNAERSRLLPAQRDTLIVVNVPSFEIEFWQEGQSVFHSKVVVGRTTRPTPMMTVNLDALILNPTWNVPYKIMVKDILPHIKRDVTYLQRHNMQLLTAWNALEEIDPAMIDWSMVNPRNFPYKIRQLSGNSNALGLYKFHTPNDRAIFLHDTPSKSLFNKPVRAFSSGCIRVQNAQQLAQLLVETQGLEQFDLAQAQPNSSIPLKRRIPVHIIYQTAWFEAGTIHYRDDIYRLDTGDHKSG
ncbi:L,D-transpeptidase family protein [Vibrio sp.]|uniref:L,D-transpeptidase family protein n=1 Tax=Vibrio sp. TaxID=678 RepID=UPI003D0FA028